MTGDQQVVAQAIDTISPPLFTAFPVSLYALLHNRNPDIPKWHYSPSFKILTIEITGKGCRIKHGKSLKIYISHSYPRLSSVALDWKLTFHKRKSCKTLIFIKSFYIFPFFLFLLVTLSLHLHSTQTQPPPCRQRMLPHFLSSLSPLSSYNTT